MYILFSALVGRKGKVIGVDMTDEQLYIARKYLISQMERFGFADPNVEFKTGDRNIHYGLFSCSPASVRTKSEDNSKGGACC